MRDSSSDFHESDPELRSNGKPMSSFFRRNGYKASTTNNPSRMKGRGKLFRNSLGQTLNGSVEDGVKLEFAPDRVEEATAEESHTVNRRTSVLAGYEAETVDQQLRPGITPLVRKKEASLSTCQATAILKHSFLFCNTGLDNDEDEDIHVKNRWITRLPEDPTVQESIECVFASQLEEGLSHEMLWESTTDDAGPISPAMLLQSRTQSRLGSMTTTAQHRKPKKTFKAGSLVHLGTYDAVTGTMSESPPKSKSKEAQEKPSASLDGATCSCSKGRKTPSLLPSEWPQYPLMLRVGSGTVVKGIRFSAQQEYLWKTGDVHTWKDALEHHWGKASKPDTPNFGCPKCMTLPINNGNEPPGESLVVDFESNLWVGTMLLRLRFSEGTTVDKYNDSKGYFAGMNRRYQAVITGSPKKAIPISDCVTGLQLEREAGKLPAKWILKGALKLLQFFAPQLECKLDHDKPYSLTPLGSTPQMFGVNCLNGRGDIENKLEEPSEGVRTLLGQASSAPTSLVRAKLRKKALDKAFLQETNHPQLTPQHEYTMEFLQHLFSFQTFEMELGSLIGNYQLKDLLNGQPLQLMAMEKSTLNKLWSFDIWHECLVGDSLKND